MLRRGAPKLDENGKPMRDARGKVIYEPYRIKVLNTINFSKSMKYNPLAYVRSEKDILKLVNVIIANTKGDGEKSSEDFWIKAERLLYCALIGYIWYEAEPEEKNFITLLELINACEAREDDETYKSPVDILFDELAQAQPEHFAVKQYVKFKMAAGKTLKSILVSCGARLSPFDIKELLGKETIDSLSQSENRGAQTSHGLSYQKLGKELMTQDEIAVMDGGKCILQLRGVRPFFSDKYDLTKHPRYKYLSDADKKNVFDVERYMKRRPAIVKPDEPFDMYELSAKELEPDNNSTKRKET